MKKITGAALFAILGFVLLVSTQAGKARAADAPKESCVTSSCHAKMAKDKFVHAPVASGECDACHHSIGKHKFEPIADVASQCYQCHEEQTTKAVVHAPVKQGQCIKCHNPHQSPNKFQLRAAGSDLCFLCHNKSIMGGKFVHGPAAVGSCASCHKAHQSDNAKLLVAAGNDLCLSCHTDKAEAIKKAKFVHTPVRDACINCHSPHSAEYQYNLSAPSNPDLCFTCHPDKEKDIKDATVPHKALDSKQKCLTCHDPHATQFPKQLVKQPAELCLGCHDRDYGTPVKVANIKKILDDTKDHHGPIRQMDCSGCHNAHGSRNFRMLRENFPDVFYASYDPNNYKVCFMCHERTLASEEKTTTLTNFRNGDTNLHFVHVNKTKGRTCRACHDAHGTNNAKHIRDNVPFGTWHLPVGFTKAENGGTCMPGCHSKYSYDRIKPVVNKGGGR